MQRVKEVILSMIPDITVGYTWNKTCVLSHIKKVMYQQISSAYDKITLQLDEFIGDNLFFLKQYEPQQKFIFSNAVQQSKKAFELFPFYDLKVLYLFTNQYSEKNNYNYQKLLKQISNFGPNFKLYFFSLDCNYASISTEKVVNNYLSCNIDDLTTNLKLSFEDLHGFKNTDQI